MKKIILILVVSFIFGLNINNYDYKKAFDIAKKENKIVLVNIIKKDCRYCNYMKIVMNKTEIKNFLNNYFVLLIYYPYELPEIFKKEYFNFVPTFLFYNKNGKLIKTIYGARSYEKFFKELKKIKKENDG
ncbi:thioredoxin family protein [Caminibacter mediatlanticus TB-2]|uniref:Thioredoxin family protein n=1 Tax=Caminibacter mediatlanticus TB-2 TaxID=391592 RepID=A0ABX5V8Q6_9BACT|nr:thioredoxin family protein [Caminibacter mediatlanticus]QCT94354.1 thioredoxin family protein [Caminibacter mediatlanticus TB-2]